MEITASLRARRASSGLCWLALGLLLLPVTGNAQTLDDESFVIFVVKKHTLDERLVKTQNHMQLTLFPMKYRSESGRREGLYVWEIKNGSRLIRQASGRYSYWQETARAPVIVFNSGDLNLARFGRVLDTGVLQLDFKNLAGDRETYELALDEAHSECPVYPLYLCP